MQITKILKVEEFLYGYKGMSLAPSPPNEIILKGNFDFTANLDGRDSISDRYEIQIRIKSNYPHALPVIMEIGNKIPKNGDYHVNHDGTICLGAPIIIKEKLIKDSSLIGLVENCLIPYLYAVSFKREHGGKFLFGELDHGEKGLIKEYKKYFKLQKTDQVYAALRLLSLKKRIANKKSCPCGCGRRLGVCKIHSILNKYRKIASRSWFAIHAKDLNKGM